jgi:ABC-type Zn uptake system ZnuABC Zn-binding protein ZnuA
VGCGGGEAWPEAPGKKRVLASFAPIECFARNVAGDDAVVLPLMTATGPHAFQGSPRDALKVRGADIFFVNGLGLDERLAGKLIRNSGQSSVQLVKLGEAIPHHKLLALEHDHDHGEEGHAHHHDHGDFDPHVWLGPEEAALMVTLLQEQLAALDPSHADAYADRAEAYRQELKKLHEDGKAMFQDKQEKTILTFHESLGYFARSFGLEIAGAIEIMPGVEPGPNKLKKLIDLCKKDKVRVIAVEPQYPNNTSAKVVRDELKRAGIDAVFVEIDPLETAPDADRTPDFYIRKMRENLKNLADTLK